MGSGTGFVVAKNVLATNAHVVQGSFVDEILVNFPSIDDQSRKVIRILYEDVARDLCLLEVDTNQSPALPMAREYRFKQGQQVTVIGNPSTSQRIQMLHAVASLHAAQCCLMQCVSR